MKAKATGPVLFGKRMRKVGEKAWMRLGVCVYWSWLSGDFEVSHAATNWRGGGIGCKEPQAAANDAERFLRKLKRELERMGA